MLAVAGLRFAQLTRLTCCAGGERVLAGQVLISKDSNIRFSEHTFLFISRCFLRNTKATCCERALLKATDSVCECLLLLDNGKLAGSAKPLALSHTELAAHSALASTPGARCSTQVSRETKSHN